MFDKETEEVNYVRVEGENQLCDEWITPLGESTFGQRRWSMATKHRVRALDPIAESATGDGEERWRAKHFRQCVHRPTAAECIRSGETVPHTYHARRGALCVKARGNQEPRITRHEQG